MEVALISALCSLLDARLPSHNLEAEAEVDLALFGEKCLSGINTLWGTALLLHSCQRWP